MCPKEQWPVIIDTLTPVWSGNTVVSDILRKLSARFTRAIRTAGLVFRMGVGGALGDPHTHQGPDAETKGRLWLIIEGQRYLCPL